jgi:hypothetical protein
MQDILCLQKKRTRDQLQRVLHICRSKYPPRYRAITPPLHLCWATCKQAGQTPHHSINQVVLIVRGLKVNLVILIKVIMKEIRVTVIIMGV